jgi:branched-chain amino acid aminotransferase
MEGMWRRSAECCLPVTDLVIQRGVGVFDSIRIYGRRAFALAEHMKRLERSASIAGIECGDIIERMYGIVREGAMRDDCPGEGESVVRLYITGGDENDHGRFPHPRYFAIFERAQPEKPESYERGVALMPTSEGRLSPVAKSVNYLFGLMQNAGQSGFKECLYCPGGEITETLSSSFFLCRGGVITTAPLGKVLDGVTRGIIIELARENGFEVEERCPLVEELKSAEEAFITGSTKEVLPVVRVGGEVIGEGRPGPIAIRLGKIFRESLDRWLDKP